MASPRVRRLTLDYELLQRVFKDSPLIQITGTAGLPPEIYRFTYNVKGLYVSGSGDILERDGHVLEVNLTLDYPRRAPQCRMLTPIFHPNFDGTSVCIGDFWAASEGLDDLVVRVGRMIAYQEYNTKSPLNGLAAKWASEHVNVLPVDSREIGGVIAAPTTYASSAPAITNPGSPALRDSDLLAPKADEMSEADPWSTRIVLR
jgi:ubiquitin-protein ligase